MRWEPGDTSSDVEDRRDEGGSGGSNFGGGGFGGFGGGGGFGGIHLGIGGTIILIILSVVFRSNFFSMLSGGGAPVPTSGNERPAARSGGSDVSRNAAEKKEVQFVSFVLDDVQKTWEKLLPEQANVPYRHAKLVLFRNSIESACGQAESATGPFYCPGDEKAYIDLAFYDELRDRFKAPGEFAQAYVLAHELGHHVQKIIGIEAKVRRSQGQNPRQRNALSVKMELQADCFAGIWGHSTQERKIIDDSDIEAGLAAAASVGDDRLQKMATGHVSPDSFTHGSSAQRMQWFRAGLSSGKISSCNTFEE